MIHNTMYGGERMVAKKGDCGGTPRVGKIGDLKPIRGRDSEVSNRGMGRRRNARRGNY